MLLTERELDSRAALRAALALAPPVRRDFVRAVTAKPGAFPPGAGGPGFIHRVAAEVQHVVHVAIGRSTQPRLAHRRS